HPERFRTPRPGAIFLTVRVLSGCTVTWTHPEFVAAVGRAFDGGGPRRERAELVRESLEARVEEIRGHVAALLEARRAA
ncbi:MAG TPA: hypothetical protein VF341_07235, partial [Anaeromyxobacteraceae bacterium]